MAVSGNSPFPAYFLLKQSVSFSSCFLNFPYQTCAPLHMFYSTVVIVFQFSCPKPSLLSEMSYYKKPWLCLLKMLYSTSFFFFSFPLNTGVNLDQSEERKSDIDTCLKIYIICFSLLFFLLLIHGCSWPCRDVCMGGFVPKLIHIWNWNKFPNFTFFQKHFSLFMKSWRDEL